LAAKAPNGKRETPVALTILTPVLDLGVAAVGDLQCGDVGVVLVGDEALEAMAIEVGEGQPRGRLGHAGFRVSSAHEAPVHGAGRRRGSSDAHQIPLIT
jgi:hypothetical protein